MHPEPKSKAKILIADDEPDTLTLFRDAFEEEGYQVFTVSNGTDAPRVIQAERPDAIILDLKIPGTDGETILADLLREKPVQAAKVFIMTGFNDFDVTKTRVRNQFGAIIADYLEKPVDIHQVVAMIKYHLGGENQS
ncbi:MAG: response regulator [Candidatus Omnitrophica bacterium]|nr:response regulator [Candidatus Omnitrophota bacterium]MDD5671715.1 response regulator [Candidatus Omnitrophota bacterium]